jgi:hypothetical protein
MTSLTLKQIFDDKNILEFCVATCMVNDKYSRIKVILDQYTYVKKSHLRYFRILVNTFDKLNQKAVIREILNRLKNGKINAEEQRLVNVYKMGRALCKIIPSGDLNQSLPRCLYPDYTMDQSSGVEHEKNAVNDDDDDDDDDDSEDDVPLVPPAATSENVHIRSFNFEKNKEKPHTETVSSNFLSVNIDMSKILDAVFNDQRFKKFEEPVCQKNFDNIQTPLNAESLATEFFITSPPPLNKRPTSDLNYVPETPRTIDINRNF